MPYKKNPATIEALALYEKHKDVRIVASITGRPATDIAAALRRNHIPHAPLENRLTMEKRERVRRQYAIEHGYKIIDCWLHRGLRAHVLKASGRIIREKM
jgi:hypothetical protein